MDRRNQGIEALPEEQRERFLAACLASGINVKRLIVTVEISHSGEGDLAQAIHDVYVSGMRRIRHYRSLVGEASWTIQFEQDARAGVFK
ncbi:hypothetical protein ACPWR0_05570 [Pandoraea pneumonica]|uniref:hypothetical protein n=1 Tax=Pandoraea pneumonica TaxID=2508299 RepID=UPI003CF4B3B7